MELPNGKLRSRITLLFEVPFFDREFKGEIPIFFVKGGMVNGPIVAPKFISLIKYASIACGKLIAPV